jgi:hypothetical protein
MTAAADGQFGRAYVIQPQPLKELHGGRRESALVARGGLAYLLGMLFLHRDDATKWLLTEQWPA